MRYSLLSIFLLSFMGKSYCQKKHDIADFKGLLARTSTNHNKIFLNGYYAEDTFMKSNTYPFEQEIAGPMFFFGNGLLFYIDATTRESYLPTELNDPEILKKNTFLFVGAHII